MPNLARAGEYIWEIKSGESAVRIYISEKLMDAIEGQALQQLSNIASLPGIISPALGMPDLHTGYGFPIGGVAATDISRGGVICPGGVGFDINCGVRLITIPIEKGEMAKRAEELGRAFFARVPSGLGSESRPVSHKDLEHVLVEGARWAVRKGYGGEEDLLYCEEGGCMPGADTAAVSKDAMERGRRQVGTLGSGNHFIELQYCDEVYDEDAAAAYGISKGKSAVMLHSGSRGFGHQVCSDYVRLMLKAVQRHKISVPDRQLACAPFSSNEGRAYFSAMTGAANYAWCNRQMMMHMLRLAIRDVFSKDESEGARLVYDVAHNIAKLERHKIGNKDVMACVHRKGATRAFGPGRDELPDRYRPVGQPVIVPGDMGRASYVLKGTENAMRYTFGSACHGAGRVMSRTGAKSKLDAQDVIDALNKDGIYIFAHSRKTIVEEAPAVYKNVDDVVDVIDGAKIARRVARFRPLAVIKG